MPNKVSQTTYMDNQLKGFEELLLNNALLKMHNKALFSTQISKMEGMVAKCIRY
jgi:hypothetical protein